MALIEEDETSIIFNVQSLVAKTTSVVVSGKRDSVINRKRGGREIAINRLVTIEMRICTILPISIKICYKWFWSN